MNTLILWFFLRFLTSIYAGVISSIKPLTQIELSIALWPPTSPVNQWLDRVFISPWMRWDALWYQRIVSTGYTATDGTAQFHPLYPWIASILSKIGINSALSLLIVSSLAGVALFFTYTVLARMDLPRKDAFFSLFIFSLAPPAFILFAPYSESLFLLCAVLCILFTRKNSWWLAGLMGGLAALTRQQGILLVIPVAWELWEKADRRLKNYLKMWHEWLAVLLIPLGMAVWILYRAIYINDFQVNWSNIQNFIYSAIISPSASKVVPVQKFIWPWQALYHSVEKILTKPDLDIWVNLITSLFFLAMLVIAWKRMRISYRLYALGITLISFSYYTGPVHPYMGLPRHLLLGFTTYIGLAALVNKPWQRLILVCLSSLGLLFLLSLYILNAWIP
jgi:Gpi18-like mannosyltransferase